MVEAIESWSYVRGDILSLDMIAEPEEDPYKEIERENMAAVFESNRVRQEDFDDGE